MQRDIELEATLVAKFVMVSPELNERGRRVWAATESLAIGYGGDAVVSSATGLARETIRKGRDEIVRGVAPAERLRRPGAGRPRIQTTQPGITAALEALVDPLTRGDPTSPLRWTCKSRAKLAAALTQRGWRVSSTTVGRLLRKLGYSLQAAQKRREGTAHPDRNAQFEYINATAVRFLRRRQPVISVDTKKKELVGQFKNAGREWQPTGQPEAVLVHDFPAARAVSSRGDRFVRSDFIIQSVRNYSERCKYEISANIPQGLNCYEHRDRTTGTTAGPALAESIVEPDRVARSAV